MIFQAAGGVCTSAVLHENRTSNGVRQAACHSCPGALVLKGCPTNQQAQNSGGKGSVIDQSGVSGQCLIQPRCCILHPQITVNILKDQLTELQTAKDALAISRTREDTLQNEVGSSSKECLFKKHYTSYYDYDIYSAPVTLITELLFSILHLAHQTADGA